ncbi:hypothetical protein [Halobacteriovorax marinus]|uniref:hypothetical protein n=1 Tax=Halobacteriovorax marinus TaxID=97084 RepID=UPI0012FD48BE|nr:hypothetical protein [Halobacteriovorax marinus]
MKNYEKKKDIEKENLTEEEKIARERDLENEIQMMNFKRSLGSVRTGLKTKKDCLSRL